LNQELTELKATHLFRTAHEEALQKEISDLEEEACGLFDKVITSICYYISVEHIVNNSIINNANILL